MDNKLQARKKQFFAAEETESLKISLKDCATVRTLKISKMREVNRNINSLSNKIVVTN